MGVEEIVDVQVNIQDAVVERASFGIGLIVGSSNKLSSKVQEFANQTAVEEVFAATDPEAVMSARYFGQDEKPTKVFIAQRDADQKQRQKFIITQLVDSTDYTINITPEGGAQQAFTHNSGVGATRASIVDGLKALIDAAGLDLLVVDNGDDLDIEANVAGTPYTATVSSNMSAQNVQLNRNISTELSAIEQLESGWYGLMSQSHADIDIKRAAAFIQPRRKIYGASSQNADIVDSENHVFTLDFDADFVAANTIDLDIDTIPVAQTLFDTDQATTLLNLATNIQNHSRVATATVTGARQITVTAQPTDVLLVVENIVVAAGASQANGEITTTIDPTTDLGAELNALGYDRTFLMYTKNADAEYPEAAFIGGRFSTDAGQQTWAFKSLAGITVDSLTSSQKSKALGNNVNTYTKVGSNNITQNGTMASGRFIDVRRLVDSQIARMEENIFRQFVTLKKIPYTNKGTAIIVGEVDAVLQDGVKNETVRRDPAPTVTAPRVQDVSANDRAARLFPDVNFTYELAGAIHKTIVRGVAAV